jgi:hypothetical protein
MPIKLDEQVLADGVDAVNRVADARSVAAQLLEPEIGHHLPFKHWRQHLCGPAQCVALRHLGQPSAQTQRYW